MASTQTGTPPPERLEFADRYYIQTAKSAIESLAHVIEEAISNEDEAISKRAERDGGEDKGTIVVSYDPKKMVLRITGDGKGLAAAEMRSRLRKVGAAPVEGAKRGFFHRGIREVFLAMGGGEMTSIGLTEDGRQVLSRAAFGPGLEMRILSEDEELSDRARTELGLSGTGTVVEIPMGRLATKKSRMFTYTQVQAQIRDCVGLRPVLNDPRREVYLEYGGEPRRRLEFAYPEGEELVAEREVEVNGEQGTLWAKVAPAPVKQGRGKRTKVAGILVRGERAAYEVSAGSRFSSHPAMGRVVGELRIDAIERLQREADAEADDESQLVYKTDRSGLNPEHLLVEAIYELIDETIGPLIVELDSAEEQRPVTPGMRRELQKLARVINQAIEGEAPGVEDLSGVDDKDPDEDDEDEEQGEGGEALPSEPPGVRVREVEDGIGFPSSRVFVHAGTTRKVKVWFDTAKIAVGAAVAIATSTDEVVTQTKLSGAAVPAAGADGIAELELTIRAGDSEGRHEIAVWSDGWKTILPVHVRFPRTSGFISEIVPDDRDWPSGSALWDPPTGIVRFFVGRPEFKAAEARARRGGEKDSWKDPQYRQLVIESVREAALWEKARQNAQVEWDDFPREDRQEDDAFHNLVCSEFQVLDYLLRAKLHKTLALT
jgi:hypothetical protein